MVGSVTVHSYLLHHRLHFHSISRWHYFNIGGVFTATHRVDLHCTFLHFKGFYILQIYC